MIFGHHSDHNQPVLHHLQQVFAFLSLTQVKSPATCACSKIQEFSWRIILCKGLNMETIFAVMNTNREAIFQVFFLYVRYCLSSISLSAVRIYAIYVNCIVIFHIFKVISFMFVVVVLLFLSFSRGFKAQRRTGKSTKSSQETQNQLKSSQDNNVLDSG